MANIYIKDVTVRFNKSVVIDKLTERLSDGDFYVMLGLSGSGKTTLLKIIAGLAFVSSGSVEIGGENIVKYSQRQMLDYHRCCGYVFQNAALISNMSIYENLSLYYNYHTDLSEKDIYLKIKKFLDYVGFDNDISQRPNILSAGEKMLVNIVRAISHEPEYIFWDSPLSNLDTHYQNRVKKIILDFKKQKKTMVLATGDIDFAFSIADKIGILQKGRIIESGTPGDIKNSNYSPTREFIDNE
ncbi:MAG: ABC transporter ATP-binding protein [Brevinematales bacterium]|jgi:phospholipid/cholesterol/gamma-HCH transport system ATP-binding protein